MVLRSGVRAYSCLGRRCPPALLIRRRRPDWATAASAIESPAMKWRWPKAVLLLPALTALVNARGGSSDSTARPIPSRVTNYLTRFGYLTEPAPGTSNQRTPESVQSALRRLQRFAGLEQTGELDRATLELLSTKRCGLPDFEKEEYGESTKSEGENVRHRHRRRRHRQHHHRAKRYLLQGSKWGTTNITYRIRNSPRTIVLNDVRRIIYEALKSWEDVSALTFRETRDPVADIQVSFERGEHNDSYPFDGPDVVLAHAFFPSPGRGGDVHFDSDEQWTERRIGDSYSREVSLISVAIHELGHSLGLHHSEVEESIMFPYYQYVTDASHSGPRLHYDDIVAIQTLYGRGEHPEPQPPPPTPKRTTTTPSPTTTTEYITTTTKEGPPDICTTSIDAISTIRQEIFVFKGRWFWRYNDQGQLIEKPVELHRFWLDFPEDITHIDAVYERTKGRDQIVFFVGKMYYEFVGHRMLPGFPKPLTHLGLPDWVDHITAAFVWDYNDKTYLFSNKDYWRFDEDVGHVEMDYPRKIKSNWHGIPVKLEGDAFADHQGRTLFFHKDQVYHFRGVFMNVARGYPKSTAEFWPHCQPNSDQGEIRFDYLRSRCSLYSSPSLLIASIVTMLLVTAAIEQR